MGGEDGGEDVLSWRAERTQSMLSVTCEACFP